VQVVQFPRDIMYPSEDIQLSLVVVHAMAVPDCWQLSIILHPHESEISQAETPQVVQSPPLSLPSEDVETLAISGHRAADPGRGAICIIKAITAILLGAALEEKRKRVLAGMQLVDYIGRPGGRLVETETDYDALFLS
jgi:hypothetical protein